MKPEITATTTLSFILFVLGSRLINGISNITYPGIGTFTSKDFKHPIYRPIVLLPESPEEIGPLFLLHTRRNRYEPVKFAYDEDSPQFPVFFDPKKPTWILMHGFNHHSLKPWMNIFKDTLLDLDDFNVFIVESRRSESGISYSLAVANIRVVGIMVGKLVEKLVNQFDTNHTTTNVNSSSYESFTLVGHSLGAHIAGYAGKYLNGSIGRIYGLDPAGPFFKNHPDPNSRLWHTDARFVFNIHTNGGTIIPGFSSGMMDTCGHVDLYMNDAHHQPGCPKEIEK